MKVLLHHCPIQQDSRKILRTDTGMPVVTIPPSFSEPPDVCKRSTVGPLGVIDFIWESGVIQLLLQKGKCLL
jgi:hypothetical protein